MATRAFLLSGDEKAVHAITQILDELEVSFEHSSDAPFTLKRLGAQRFDLLVVDCDNSQTATQVFNSARSSALNKAAIAIAIVEGKAGVPNAFRLGASLVLTKPVSLEQVRNTLRTGIGMTRKDGPESRPAVTQIPAAQAPSIAPTTLPSHPVTPVVPAPTPISVVPPVLPSIPAPVPPAPMVAPAPIASAHSAPVVSGPAPVKPAPVETPVPHSVLQLPTAPVASGPEPPAPALKPLSPVPVEQKSVTALVPPAAKPAVPDLSSLLASLPASTPTPVTPLPTSLGSAAAAAAPAPARSESFSSLLAQPAKDVAAKEPEAKLFPDSEPAPLESLHETDITDADDSAQSLRAHAVPAFGGLSKQPFAGIETSKRSYTGLIAVGFLVVLAAGLTAAWYLKPQFRNVVLWEYAQATQRIAAWRGHSTPVPAAKPTVPAPQPASAPQPQSASSQPSTPPPSIPADGQTPPSPANNAANSATPAVPAPASVNTAATAPSSAARAAAVPASPATPDKTAKPVTESAKPEAAARPYASSAPASATKSPAAQAQGPAGELYEVPEDYADDQVIHRVRPIYPRQARAKKLQGTVVLQAIVDKQGKVNSLQLVSGDPVLAQAAADAVKQWRYKPYSHNGDPADFQTRVTVDFHQP